MDAANSQKAKGKGRESIQTDGHNDCQWRKIPQPHQLQLANLTPSSGGSSSQLGLFQPGLCLA